VLAGFCLVAAVSAKRFISVVTDKVLSDLHKETYAAKRIAQNILEMGSWEPEKLKNALRELEAGGYVKSKDYKRTNGFL